MAHNIETFADGSAAFVSARIPAWHRLGTVTPDAMTAAEAAEMSKLARWNVRKLPMHITAEDGSDIGVTNRVATVRTNPVTGGTDYLGYVGHEYKIVQNEDAFGFLDTLVDEAGAHWETAGSLGRGERVFMCMKMPEGIQIAGQDAHDVYLIATNGHDGFVPFTVAVTPIRVVCQNTLTMGLASARQMWKIRHTSRMEGRIDEARESLKLTYEYMSAFQLELEMMLDTAFTNSQFEELAETMFADAKSAGAQKAVDSKRATLWGLWTAPTQDFGRNTKYGAYNAMTEYADWFAPIQGDDPDGMKRAKRAMTSDVVQDFKDLALAEIRRA